MRDSLTETKAKKLVFFLKMRRGLTNLSSNWRTTRLNLGFLRVECLFGKKRIKLFAFHTWGCEESRPREQCGCRDNELI